MNDLKRLYIILWIFIIMVKPMGPLYSQNRVNPLKEVYKSMDSISLQLQCYYPSDYHKGQQRAAIIFFFGGGWSSRHIDQFVPQAAYFVKHGLIGIIADYRVHEVDHSTVIDAIQDAKSAIKFMKIHYSELGIDTNRIIAAGGSAGGQLAAACDLTNLDDSGGDAKVSSKPNALILFNPVINNGPGHYGYERTEGRYAEISPYHNIRKCAAPTLIFSGSADKIVSPKEVNEYQDRMRKFGNRCDVYLYPDQVHGFYQFVQEGNNFYFQDTLKKSMEFLKSLKII